MQHEYTYSQAREILDWMANNPDIIIADTARHWKHVYPNLGASSVSRWCKNASNVRRQAGEEERLQLHGPLWRFRVHKSDQFQVFEKMLHAWCVKRRKKGKSLNPWVLHTILQEPKWVAVHHHALRLGKPFLKSKTWINTFLHRHEFTPVKISNLRGSDLAAVKDHMTQWTGIMREHLLAPLPDEELPNAAALGYRYDPITGRFNLTRRYNADQASQEVDKI